MSLTRRELALALALVTAVKPGRAKAQVMNALIVADGGSASEAPAACRDAYELAVSQGADFLGAELFPTADGTLVARPEGGLGATTDIARRQEFAGRQRTRTVDGVAQTDWFTEDFTLAELKSLTCVGPASSRPANRRQASAPVILTLQEVIDVARAASIRSARVVGVYAGLRHPAYFASIDLQLEARLAEVIRANGYNSPAAAMFVTASEASALKALVSLTKARLVRRVEAQDSPSSTIEAEELADIRSYAGVVAPDAELLVREPRGSGPVTANSLIERAHASGLAVHAWASAPPSAPALRGSLLEALFLGGADGIVCRTPAVALRARNRAMGRVRRERRAAQGAEVVNWSSANRA